jgi:hypothetical protein
MDTCIILSSFLQEEDLGKMEIKDNRISNIEQACLPMHWPMWWQAGLPAMAWAFPVAGRD